ncbi:MAG: MBL fold metallo-hydrolase [Chlamydiales bacterium]|nr:MBL fold metallo-hydrolase [Chlamydiia bacterium]MCP5508094.1 MBL fold metallo-hydrolase [Chlamydiales bacterium]
MQITFLGAAGVVTGSKYLIEFAGKKLLVDSGLFQGLKELRVLNWDPPRFDPVAIDGVLLTHGHLDHSGYLPRLVKLGFKGKIYCTEPTKRIAEIILMDSAQVQEEEAERANKGKYSKHHPAEPLYDKKDVHRTMKLFHTVEEGQWNEILGLDVRFQYNGHILGATFIEIERNGTTIVFSGDIGRESDLLLYPPKKPEKADILLIESTYGGKFHPEEENAIDQLEKIIKETIHRGGSVFIPSFAVERTQLLMFILWRLVKERRIPKVPMVMDSPMGADVLELLRHTASWHKLSNDDCQQMCGQFWITKSFKETMKLRSDPDSKIIIAGSGMVTGGRILSYLETRSSHEKDTLLLAGYQAEGTRGRKLLEGEKELKIYGKVYPFRMHLHLLEGLSAHADQPGLLHWMSNLKVQPKKLFITHGEKEQSEALKKKIKELKDWDAVLPSLYQKFKI